MRTTLRLLHTNSTTEFRLRGTTSRNSRLPHRTGELRGIARRALVPRVHARRDEFGNYYR